MKKSMTGFKSYSSLLTDNIGNPSRAAATKLQTFRKWDRIEMFKENQLNRDLKWC